MYQDLIGQIIKKNQTTIAEKVLSSDKRKFQKHLDIVQPKGKEKKIIIPDTTSIIRRSPTLIKSAEQGKIIQKTLADRIRSAVKKSLTTHNVTTTTGTVNKKIVKDLEKSLKGVYQEYTQNNPKYKMPANIHAIAVTETRTVINSVRHEYVKRINDETGDDYQVKKTWIHNDSLSKEENWRPKHKRLSGKTIALNAVFNVNGYSSDRPHGEGLPASEVINCNCELEYKWVRRKNK